MLKLSKYNVGKAVLASCLALGGIVTADTLSDPTGVKAEVKHKVDVSASYKSPYSNAFQASLTVRGPYDSMTDFRTKHTPVFEIRNGSGVLTQRGSLNQWKQRSNPEVDKYEFDSITNISVSSLNPGNYRIYVSIPMDDGPIDENVNNHFTSGFTINPDRTITNIRQ